MGRLHAWLNSKFQMSSSNQICKKIVIVCRGDDENACDNAISEATRRIKAGNLSGHDRTDDGAFYFDVTDSVAKEDRPA